MKHLLWLLTFCITGCGVSVHFGPPTLGTCVDALSTRFKLVEDIKHKAEIGLGIIQVCTIYKNDASTIIKELE